MAETEKQMRARLQAEMAEQHAMDVRTAKAEQKAETEKENARLAGAGKMVLTASMVDMEYLLNHSLDTKYTRVNGGKHRPARWDNQLRGGAFLAVGLLEEHEATASVINVLHAHLHRSGK